MELRRQLALTATKGPKPVAIPLTRDSFAQPGTFMIPLKSARRTKPFTAPIEQAADINACFGLSLPTGHLAIVTSGGYAHLLAERVRR